MATKKEYDAKKAAKGAAKLQAKVQKEDLSLTFDFDPRALQFVGPIIVTQLTVTNAEIALHHSTGQQPPVPIQCRFLIDTGADSCVVKHEIAQKAGLKLIASGISLSGVGVDTSGQVFVGKVSFSGPSKIAAGVNHHVDVETQIFAGKLETNEFDGIIGRDVLSHFELKYHGKTGQVIMKFLR